MNELEFKEVMTALEIPIIGIKKYSDYNIYTCTWNGHSISYTTNSPYCLIEDEDKEKEKKISSLIATTILEKYPNISSTIHIPTNPKFLNKTYISSKEGLLMFILESQDYYAKKWELPEIYVAQYQKLLNSITTKLINQTANLSFPAENWIENISLLPKNATKATTKSSTKKRILIQYPQKRLK